MPPSRELTLLIDADTKTRLEEHLKIKAPVRIKIRTTPSGRVHGRYHSGSRLITIELGIPLATNSRLTHITTEVLKTLLHEYRHAHQYDIWDAKRIERDNKRPYHQQEMEQDAERFASGAVSEWKSLGRIRTKGTISNLRRLSATERKLK